MVARGEEATVVVAVIAAHNGFSSKKKWIFACCAKLQKTITFTFPRRMRNVCWKFLWNSDKRENNRQTLLPVRILYLRGANTNNEIGHFRRRHSNFPQHQHHSWTPFTLPGHQVRPIISYVIIFFQLKRIQWNNFKLMRFRVALHTPPSNRYSPIHTLLFTGSLKTQFCVLIRADT